MRYTDKHYDCIVIYDDRGIIRENEYKEISINNLKYNTFELIEEQQDIDIQAIEGFYIDLDFNDIEKWEDELKITSKIDELIKAVKQLDNKIRKE